MNFSSPPHIPNYYLQAFQNVSPPQQQQPILWPTPSSKQFGAQPPNSCSYDPQSIWTYPNWETSPQGAKHHIHGWRYSPKCKLMVEFLHINLFMCHAHWSNWFAFNFGLGNNDEFKKQKWLSSHKHPAPCNPTRLRWKDGTSPHGEYSDQLQNPDSHCSLCKAFSYPYPNVIVTIGHWFLVC